jgi:glycerate kinase
MSAAQVADHLAAGLRRSIPGVELRQVPIADGGEGTVAALTRSGFELVREVVTGPTGEPVAARFAWRGDTAVVELAEASGLGRLPGSRLAPMVATTRGTGELILAALDQGCRRVVLAVGGSAGTDGGAGLVQALGGHVVDSQGAEVGPGGAGLASVESVDPTRLDSRLRCTTIVLASDVDNPLTGPNGAARVFGPQKGASPAEVELLEAALARWAGVVAVRSGADLSASPGAGAAGGAGFAALALLGAERRPGVDVVLELVGFHDIVSAADLVVTGEGSLDPQTLHGKAPAGVAHAAARAGIPAVAVVGQCLLTPSEVARVGLSHVFALTELEPDVAVAMRDAERLVELMAETRIGRWLLAAGGPAAARADSTEHD